MDVFIKEPLLEWRDRAIKSAKNQKHTRELSPDYAYASADTNSSSLNAPTWYPAKKLAIASRKLKNHSPVQILCDELSLGHHDKPWFESVKKVICGTREHNIRAKIKDENLCESVAEQVDCLIDLATDPNILGRTWLGWSPWV
jgi:DNA-dependent protein kinase catalytic subunit